MLFDILGFGMNSKKAHSMGAKQKFIQMLLGEESVSVYWADQDQDSYSELKNEDAVVTVHHKKKKPQPEQAPKQVEGTLLDFGDSPTTTTTTTIVDSADEEPKKKKKKKRTESVDSNVAHSPTTSGKNIAFEELYCCAFRMLDQEWYSTNATYFNFPTVLHNALLRVESLLETKVSTLDELIAFNKANKV